MYFCYTARNKVKDWKGNELGLLGLLISVVFTEFRFHVHLEEK